MNVFVGFMSFVLFLVYGGKLVRRARANVEIERDGPEKSPCDVTKKMI